MTKQEKLSRAKDMVNFRIDAFKREAKRLKIKLSERYLDVARTKLEMKVCKELDIEYFDYCKNFTK